MFGPRETAQTRSLTGCSPLRKRNSFSNLYMISEQLVWEEQTPITQILSLFQYDGSCHIDVFSLNRVTVFTSLRGRPCFSGSCVAWLPALGSPLHGLHRCFPRLAGGWTKASHTCLVISIFRPRPPSNTPSLWSF